MMELAGREPRKARASLQTGGSRDPVDNVCLTAAGHPGVEKREIQVKRTSAPERLGNDVEDGKEEDLLVGAELAGALTKSESDGVEGPDHDEGERDLVVEAADLGAAEEGGGAARGDELEEDPGEGDAREGEEAPLAGLGGVDAGDDTRDDHDLVSEDEHDDLGNGQASKEGEVEEKQRRGEGPVEQSGRTARDTAFSVATGKNKPPKHVKMRRLTSSVEELAGRAVTVLANGGESLADAGGHGKVGESGDSGDEEGGGVHQTVAVGSALGRDEEEYGEAGHDEEDSPEVGVTPLGGHDGVLEVRGDGGDGDIGLLEGVKDAVS
ncbi:hypothetical protein L1887_48412 [Cichorium endivia]|nr:hypothetical protein L1887_48412 [Cichorium endivia]